MADGRNFMYELNHAMPVFGAMKFGTYLENLVAQLNAAVVDAAARTARHSSAVMSNPGLAIHGAGSTLAKAGNAFIASAAGTIVRKAANTDMAALAGTLATAKSAAWAFYIDAAGTLTSSAKTADVATHDLAVAAIPAPPAGKAMIGVVVIDNASGSNFVGATTALDAVGLTVTYYSTPTGAGLQPAATAVAVTAPSKVV